MEVIKYKDASYPARWINNGAEDVLVSVDILQNALLDYDGNYKDKIAEWVDSEIFYYLTPSDFTKSDDEIKDILSTIQI